MPPRKTYNNFDEFQHDIDNESLIGDEDTDNLLEDDDLKLLQGPTLPEPPPKARKKPGRPRKKK
jgi:hypothetical protein